MGERQLFLNEIKDRRGGPGRASKLLASIEKSPFPMCDGGDGYGPQNP